MRVKDKVIVVTGGANGIGEAMCRRFVAEGCRALVVADLDEQRAKKVASEMDAKGIKTDVANEKDIMDLVLETEKRFGPIDLFCSNAGIPSLDEPGWMASSCPNEIWQRSWPICMPPARFFLP